MDISHRSVGCPCLEAKLAPISIVISLKKKKKKNLLLMIGEVFGGGGSILCRWELTEGNRGETCLCNHTKLLIFC